MVTLILPAQGLLEEHTMQSRPTQSEDIPEYGPHNLCQSKHTCKPIQLFFIIVMVDGDGVKGRPRKRWREVLRDMRKKGLCRVEDAWDRSRWRRMLWEGHR